MKPWVKVLIATLLLAIPASLPAAPATFEIDILQEDWEDLGRPQTADLAEPALRKLHDRQPLFSVRAEDVESYLWQTQRITLTREASARLTDLIRRQWPAMAAIGDEPSGPRLDRAGELPGAESPQEVMAKMKAAAAAGDYAAVMNFIEPVTRRRLAAAKLWGAYLRISIAETNAASNASIAAQESYFTAEERADAAQESEKEAKRAAELRQRLASLLNGFGLALDLAPAMPVQDIPLGEPLEALIENVDQGKLIAALDEFLFPDDPPLAAPGPKTSPEVTDYRIAGDRATARSGDHVLDFVRIDGRWYSLPPPLPEISEPRKTP